MIRSGLSSIHFCALRRTRARPSNPYASHPAWASRARRAISATCSAPSLGTVVISSPVAGFSTAIASAAALPFTSVEVCSVTLAIVAPSARLRQGYRSLAGQPGSAAAGQALGGIELDRLDHRRLRGPIAGACREALDRVDGLHAGADAAEDGVLAVEPRGAIGGDDEELRAVGVGAGVGHRERAADDLVLVDLVLERVSGA